MEAKERIIVALDVADIDEAKRVVDLLSPHVGLFKIGLGFIWSVISQLVLLPSKEAIYTLMKIRTLVAAIGGKRCFLDGKLADIPNTIKDASISISMMGVRMFNVHASAGKEAIVAAVANRGSAIVLGVTVLTSIDEEECFSIFGDNPRNKVSQFVLTLIGADAGGIICSPQELTAIRHDFNFEHHSGFLRVVPGIRPEWAAKGDQKRVMTPAEAIKAGADYLVIGRPITKPPAEIGGPVESAKRIAEEIAGALK